MQALRISAKSTDLNFIGEIVRDTIPEVGSVVTVFDYPAVTRYEVLRHDKNGRKEHWLPHEAVVLILSRLEVVERSTRTERSIGIDPAKDVLTRLEQIGKLAQSYITEQRRLRICHSDFVAMCEKSGISSDLAHYDGLAFRGIPVSVEEKGAEWNASTVFEGYNPDMCVLRVTLPGGIPFVMDAKVLDICNRLVVGDLDEAGATGEIYFRFRERDWAITPDTERGIENMIDCMLESVLPAYDGAQEIITLAHRPQTGMSLPDTQGASDADRVQVFGHRQSG